MLSGMWSELMMTPAISCPLWSSMYECQRVSCFVVRGCAVSRRYINVCNKNQQKRENPFDSFS